MGPICVVSQAFGSKADEIKARYFQQKFLYNVYLEYTEITNKPTIEKTKDQTS